MNLQKKLAIASLIVVLGALTTYWGMERVPPARVLADNPSEFADYAVTETLTFRPGNVSDFSLQRDYFTPKGWDNLLKLLSGAGEIDPNGVPIATSTFKRGNIDPVVEKTPDDPNVSNVEVIGTLTVVKASSKPVIQNASVKLRIRTKVLEPGQSLGIEAISIDDAD